MLRTKADHFVSESVRPLLRADERVLRQAYAADRDVGSAGVVGALLAKGLFAVLTTQRIVLMSSRLAILGPGFKNNGVESIERNAIVGVGLDENALVLNLVETR